LGGIKEELEKDQPIGPLSEEIKHWRREKDKAKRRLFRKMRYETSSHEGN